MDREPAATMIPGDDPVAVALLLAESGGDLGAIGGLLAEHPSLAWARFSRLTEERGPRCTWSTTGPGTSPTAPRSSSCWSAPAPIPARRRPSGTVRTLRRRCTG